MSMFETFLYNLGAIAFAASIPAGMFWLIGRIERPRRRQK